MRYIALKIAPCNITIKTVVLSTNHVQIAILRTCVFPRLARVAGFRVRVGLALSVANWYLIQQITQATGLKTYLILWIQIKIGRDRQNTNQQKQGKGNSYLKEGMFYVPIQNVHMFPAIHAKPKACTGTQKIACLINNYNKNDRKRLAQ